MPSTVGRYSASNQHRWPLAQPVNAPHSYAHDCKANIDRLGVGESFDQMARRLLQCPSQPTDLIDRRRRPMAEEQPFNTTSATGITAAAHERNAQLSERYRKQLIELEPRYL